MNRMLVSLFALGAMLIGVGPAAASGHGPLFGAATPTLGRGGWSIDQAWTLRAGNDDAREQMAQDDAVVWHH
jgi:hypothetical protein